LNLRAAQFQDIRVREALGLALDFEWMNRQMFYGLQAREGLLRQQRLPARRARRRPDELALLEPLRGKLRSGRVRPDAPRRRRPTRRVAARQPARRRANCSSRRAGTYRDGALRNAKGEPLSSSTWTTRAALSRVISVLVRNLEKLGIQLQPAHRRLRAVPAAPGQNSTST
jgi:microcin C transport system substrate-binding protein